MRITYIFHSCFAIECEGFSILIDYFKDSGKGPRCGYVHDTLLKNPGPLYILSSHSHPDHFSSEIFQWKEQKQDIVYILAEEIRKKKKLDESSAIFLKKGDIFQDEHLRIEAFGSTDIGISMLIDTENKRLFHAGDLNNWHWKDESTSTEVKEANGNYLKELDDLLKVTNYTDIAFFPVDPRLGADFYLGAQQFIDRIKTGVFIPMHFWEHPAEAAIFGPYAESKGCRFVLFSYPGEGATF